MTTYVVDSSVLTRLDRPAVLKRIMEIGTSKCKVPAVAVLEYSGGAGSLEAHVRRVEQLRLVFAVVGASTWAQERTIEMQRLLVAKDLHRSTKMPSLLIAATAEQLDATVLHYDRDFDTVSRVIKQPCEWVVTAGLLDGQGE